MCAMATRRAYPPRIQLFARTGNICTLVQKSPRVFGPGCASASRANLGASSISAGYENCVKAPSTHPPPEAMRCDRGGGENPHAQGSRGVRIRTDSGASSVSAGRGKRLRRQAREASDRYARVAVLVVEAHELRVAEVEPLEGLLEVEAVEGLLDRGVDFRVVVALRK